MDFVVNQLKPFIDSTYRTLPDRDHCFTGGSSAGGLISFMLHWEYNETFSKALCFSPAF
jgi:enterochelin esterase-like enzyme